MRSIFGILSLLVALGIVAVVVKKQMAVTPSGAPPTSGAAIDSALEATQKQSLQQTQQQFKQALDTAVQSGQKRDAAGDEK